MERTREHSERGESKTLWRLVHARHSESRHVFNVNSDTGGRIPRKEVASEGRCQHIPTISVVFSSASSHILVSVLRTLITHPIARGGSSSLGKQSCIHLNIHISAHFNTTFPTLLVSFVEFWWCLKGCDRLWPIRLWPSLLADFGQSDFGQTDFGQKILTDFGQPQLTDFGQTCPEVGASKWGARTWKK